MNMLEVKILIQQDDKNKYVWLWIRENVSITGCNVNGNGWMQLNFPALAAFFESL